MTTRPTLFVVLAAGKGTRMKSPLPKVLHRIGGRAMVAHVLDMARQAGGEVALVLGPGGDPIAAEARKVVPGVQIAEQREQSGTGDAVLAARSAIAAHPESDVIVLFADTPLVPGEVIGRLKDALGAGAGVAVLGFKAADPTGYGRLLRDGDGGLLAIREEKDASEAERSVDLCNSGVMAFRVPDLVGLLSKIGNDNAKGEYYLTDVVSIARAAGIAASVVTCAESDVLGVNSQEQLASAEAIWQARARSRLMAEGVSMIAPETVFVSFDTEIAGGVTIEPNVVFGPGVRIEAGAQILAFSHIEGATVGRSARVGPFARLRPGAQLGPDVHIGNYVEVKNVTLGEGAKANHLSYLGDGSVGAGANIGAGTITCNYDGFFKYKTRIGAGAFIGSNSALVAPVTIGDGAIVAAGSTVTSDVEADALALVRPPQTEKPGWAAKFRNVMRARKESR
jgi:bifunctional UDP-N-acetylglucosamine pyrophosphorylase / glucosamine-1-phosphate N-acetyltransferase